MGVFDFLGFGGGIGDLLFPPVGNPFAAADAIGLNVPNELSDPLGALGDAFKSDRDPNNPTNLPPQFIGGLNFLLNQAQGLGEQTSPLTPALSSQTLSGINRLGQTDPLALSTLRDTAGGQFTGLSNPALQAASDFAANRASREVSDVFTASGRTGSPAQQKAISEAVTGAISPFAFQNLENERARQLNAALSLNQFQRQGATGQLLGGQIIDEQARMSLLDPFRRLGLISDPILGSVSALSGAAAANPEIQRNRAATALGGAASGAALGTAVAPGIGTGIGAIGGGLLGAFA